MNHRFTIKNLFRAISVCVFLIFFCSNIGRSQVNVLDENFETSPVTSLFNLGDASLINGSSPCGKGSRGNSTDFNSTNVDFGGGSYFLGVNPESPCGGVYVASIYSDTLDFSAFDSVFIDCKYFISSTLTWGPVTLEIIASNGVTADTIHTSVFSSTDAWSSSSNRFSNTILTNQVAIKINMGGGEGVGLDNLQIYGYLNTAGISDNESNLKLKVFPNPSSEYLSIITDHPVERVDLMDITGRSILVKNYQNLSQVDISTVPNGTYLLLVTDIKGNKLSQKIVIQH